MGFSFMEAFMDELDKLGIVSMNEVRWFSSAPHAMSELETLIKRDRNHPGVIMWSIGNEEPLFMEERGRRIARSMYAAAKKLDSTRPITAAADRKPDSATVYDFCDIMLHFLPHYTTFHHSFPHFTPQSIKVQ